MKTKYNFLILLLLLTMQLSSQTWDVYIGGSSSDEYGFDVIETYDHGYLFVCNEEITSTRIVKLDINGNVLWQKSYNHNNDFLQGYKIIETSDQGFVMVGLSAFYSSVKGDPIVIKFDACFEIEWCRIIYKPNAPNTGVAMDVVENNEQELVILTDGNADNPMDWINLYGMSLSGDLLWEHAYVTQDDYQNYVYHTNVQDLIEVNGEYYIGGFCHYSPSGTLPAYIRPMIVGIDQDFEEKWMLPIGIMDDIQGQLTYLNYFNNDTIWGGGSFRWDNGSKSKPLFCAVSPEGEELGYYTIENDSIQQGYQHAKEQFSLGYLGSGKLIGSSSHAFTPTTANDGQIIFDTLGNVYNYVMQPNTGMPFRMAKAMDDKFLQCDTYFYENGNGDAHLHKFNKDLEADTVYTQAFEYDFHCPETIESEDIQLDNCIPVGVEELPTPKEYYSYIATIPIHIYPNPASNIVHFELENTEHHKNILLQVYDLQSRPVFQTPIAKGQTTAQTDVNHWASGMYAVVVFSNGKVVGREKFVVR